jgi:hypothetical protein
VTAGRSAICKVAAAFGGASIRINSAAQPSMKKAPAFLPGLQFTR